MENNRNTIIIFAFIVVIAIFLFKNNTRNEGYQQTLMPFNTEGNINPQFGMDKFYENELEGRASAVLGAYRADSDITKQSTVCSNTLQNRQVDGKFITCCQKCMVSLKNQEKNTILYYNKFRELQNKVANLENKLNFVKDVSSSYRKKLGFCKRNLTLDPVVQKCHGNYKLTGNTLTGLGVETHQ